MDQYLVKLEVFYDQKMKYLTKKDKFIKCQKCEGEKNFKESKDEIILSCGSDKGDQCGPQIIIKLPKYMHYENKINKLKEGLNDEYNWEILQKFFNVSEEAKKSEERQEKINEEIRRIEQLYFEKNMALKQEQIQIFYDQRIRKTKECNEIIKKLNEEGEEQKADLRKKYIKYNEDWNINKRRGPITKGPSDEFKQNVDIYLAYPSAYIDSRDKVSGKLYFDYAEREQHIRLLGGLRTIMQDWLVGDIVSDKKLRPIHTKESLLQEINRILNYYEYIGL